MLSMALGAEETETGPGPSQMGVFVRFSMCLSLTSAVVGSLEDTKKTLYGRFLVVCPGGAVPASETEFSSAQP